MDSELVIKSIAIVLTAVFSLAQLRNMIPRSHNRVKLDMEILAMLDSSHPRYQDIKQSIDARLEALFPPDGTFEDSKWTARVSRWIQKPKDFAIGIVMLFLAVSVGLYLLATGHWEWAILPGLLLFPGMGGILQGMGYEPDK